MREYVVKVTDALPDAFQRFEDEWSPEQELVRCEDCKHYNKDTGHCECGIIHGYMETWFCADGEKVSEKA